ncbi:MAG TPA: TonB-dependent receptor [Gemmatimonas sp.]|nr:TonB-dependent receptor [Gemmatimonas sp.]
MAAALACLLLPLAAGAQRSTYVLRGQVADSAGTPVPGARVALVSLGRRGTSNTDGGFVFTGLLAGPHTITVSQVGYAPATRQVTVPDTATALVIRLQRTGVQLVAVQVTATPAASLAKDSPQPTAVLEGAELRRSQGAALGETLELVPGIRSLSMSTGIGKPVIRGMTHYRVVTLDNGQRSETQSWGHDHSPNVETATAERVEVIKGPASVLYGSDAIGGVINVIAQPVPDALDTPAFMRGLFTTGYNHAVRGANGTLSSEGARGGFGARGAVTMRRSGDMRTPDGTLGNTNNRATALEGAAGYRAPWGTLSARYAGRDERIEIFDDPITAPGYSGFQLIDTQRGALEFTAPVRASRLQLNVGHERNLRQEFADATASSPDLGLYVSNWTGFANLHHAKTGPFTGTVGASLMSSDFENRGSERLIPASRTRSAGIYVFEQADAGPLRTTFGLRYDYRTLATDGESRIGVAADSRTFSAVTGSAGLLLHVNDALSLVTNVARGFRAPAAPDLFANGFHEGTRAFERGNPNLGVETSLNTEIGARVATRDLTAEVTAYRNVISDYIYHRPFGTSRNVFDSLQVVQGNARLVGIEASAAYRPVRYATLQLSGDFVRGDNTTARVPLTFIPPMRVLYGVRLDDNERRGTLRMPFVSFSGETHARQGRLDPRDVAPPGYTLLSAATGVTIMVPRGALTVDVSMRNLGNVRYRDFMSRYKEFALSPGRALVLRVSTPL